MLTLKHRRTYTGTCFLVVCYFRYLLLTVIIIIIIIIINEFHRDASLTKTSGPLSFKTKVFVRSATMVKIYVFQNWSH